MADSTKIVTAKLLVGYRTKPVDNIKDLVPKFQAPANYKDKDKIDAYVAASEAEFMQSAHLNPYLGTLDYVVIVDKANERIGRWSSKGREKGSGQLPVCLAARAWLLKEYPEAWSSELVDRPTKPRAMFIAFEPRTFLKLLGIECSLPPNDNPLPASMWYGNVDHRDITEAMIPREAAKFVTWSTVFTQRGIKPKEGWVGPCVDPEEDVVLLTELASQVNFL